MMLTIKMADNTEKYKEILLPRNNYCSHFGDTCDVCMCIYKILHRWNQTLYRKGIMPLPNLLCFNQTHVSDSLPSQ